MRRLLVGPSESVAMIPLHAAALVIIVRVLLSHRYEGWLRLIAAATLGLYTPALFFIYSDRYSILAWLLTLLICCVWVRDEGLPWLEQRFPVFLGGIQRQPIVVWLTRRLDELARAAGMAPQRAISAG
jgi:surface polysaccharide O-acyltransferase-like enzyme